MLSASRTTGGTFVKPYDTPRRPEARIAVVAHAGFIRHTLSAFTAGLPERAAGDLRRDFANCEMRTLVLTDTSGEVAPVLDDPLAFPGGYAWKEGAAAGNGGRAI